MVKASMLMNVATRIDMVVTATLTAALKATTTAESIISTIPTTVIWMATEALAAPALMEEIFASISPVTMGMEIISAMALVEEILANISPATVVTAQQVVMKDMASIAGNITKVVTMHQLAIKAIVNIWAEVALQVVMTQAMVSTVVRIIMAQIGTMDEFKADTEEHITVTVTKILTGTMPNPSGRFHS